MGRKPFIDFLGKKVLVTGASSGIGRAIAVELSYHNAELFLIGRDEERLNETAGLLKNGNHTTILLDLNDISEIFTKIKDFSQKYGRIYGFCHSAGIAETRPLSALKADSFKSIINVNLISGIEICRAVARRDVVEEEGGSILFISSVYALKGKPGEIAYSASKGAVTSAVRAMAVELARKKIRVNTISPGLIRTHMATKAFSLLTEQQVRALEKDFPLGIGTPEDVARAVAFLLAPQNSWITGTDFVIDGGYTIS